MLRAIVFSIFLIFCIGHVQAQTTTNNNLQSSFSYSLTKGFNKDNINPLALGEPFILPETSLAKLPRQVLFQLLPVDFFPSIETETDQFRRKALRYGVAYFRDCEIPGLTGFYDVIIGIRLDTRSGKLETRYFRTATVLNPKIVQFPEDRPAFAVLKDTDATAMIFLFENNKEELITYEGLFTDDPHAVNSIGADDVVGVSTDKTRGRFALFVRGGQNRSSLFLLLTDASMKNLQSVELAKDVSSSDQTFIFEIIPALLANAPSTTNANVINTTNAKVPSATNAK